MIHVLVNAPSPTDATSFYRSYGPLLRLSRQNKICFIPNDGMKSSWVTMAMADIVIVQRPYTDEHLDFCSLAKSCNKKLILDYDDDLFNVPSENPAYQAYASQETKNKVASMLGLADIVMVSTPKLKELYSLYAKRCVVVPNAWNPEFMSEPIYKQTKTALWRGSPSHIKDLYHVKERIIELVKDNDDVNFEFMGYHPWFISERANVSIVGGKTLDFYFKYIKKVAPRIMHVPLCINEFNEAKSNIAWIEATHASSICLAPNLPEWRREGIVNYENPNDYKKKFQTILNGEYSQNIKRSYEWIMDNIQLDKINEIRMGCFHEVLDV